MEERSRKGHGAFSHNRSELAKLISIQSQVNIGYPRFRHVELKILIGFHADWSCQMKNPGAFGLISFLYACVIRRARNSFYDYPSSQLNTYFFIGKTIAVHSSTVGTAKECNQYCR